MELKWKRGKLCRLTQCSFLLRSLILLLEQLNVSVGFVVELEVLVGHCICFERPQGNPLQSFKIICWVFYFRIPVNFF